MSRKSGKRTHQAQQDRVVIDPTRTWYVARTFTGRDEKAAETLAECEVSIWRPLEKLDTVRRGRIVTGMFPVFPGYLFAGVHGPVRPLFACREVIDVLGADAPLSLPAALVQAIADQITGHTRSERHRAAAMFRVGEMRNVVRGPFRNFIAEVVAILSDGRIKVDIAIFGRSTPVELEPDWLGEPVDIC